MPLDVRAILARTLMTGGVLLVLFAAFQVWGTAAVAWHGQRSLNAELADELNGGRRPLGHMALAGSTATPSQQPQAPISGGETTAGPQGQEPIGAPAPPLVAGEPIGRIELRSIGVTKAVVLGVGRDELRRGPGLYPSSPLPGHRGNTAIAGHRTTHGAPFAHLDLLKPGDPIVVETVEGRFTYEVNGQRQLDGSLTGHLIVDPTAVEVLSDHGDDRLTLTACHPRYSARQRIVVTATLVDSPIPLPPAAPVSAAAASAAGAVTTIALQADQVEPAAVVALVTASPQEALGWQSAAVEPTVLWATVNMQIAHAGWVLSRLWRRRPARVISGAALVMPLFTFFVHLDRLLPAL